MRFYSMLRAEVDFQQHRHNHYPYQNTDRDVDVRELHAPNHLKRRRQKFTESNTDQDTKKYPRGEPSFKDAQRG
jgi:hypothetical protein